MAPSSVTPLCPRYHYAVELIGRRWTGAILRILLGDSRRFAELAASIPDLSDRMLAERLRELEQEGVVARTVVPDTPVRIEYSLTPMGRGLETSMRALGAWAERWLPETDGRSGIASDKAGLTPAGKSPQKAGPAPVVKTSPKPREKAGRKSMEKPGPAPTRRAARG
jgi:DNA-binding HxlR family transcriptional regulator